METNLINNEIYHSLSERWYGASDHPIALLRKETEFNSKWILRELKSVAGASVLDVGCGAGFLSNRLARHKFEVTGVDLAEDALAVAAEHDSTRSVRYVAGDAYDLRFAAGSFDVVACMDVLEHVEDPSRVIRSIARVLKPGGIFFFHTMNRTWLSYLIALKGVEWFVKNTPERMHVFSMFIKPAELDRMCADAGLRAEKWTGLRPELNRAFLSLLLRGTVGEKFKFRLTRSLAISYMGKARKA